VGVTRLDVIKDFHAHQVRGARSRPRRRNPVVTQIDALNDTLQAFYAPGGRTKPRMDRIADLLYLFLESATRHLRVDRVDNEVLKQDLVGDLWERLLNGRLQRDLPIRNKGYFGVLARHKAIDMQRRERTSHMEGIPEIASTGVRPSEAMILAALRATTEYSGRQASIETPDMTYLRRWYGHRPDAVLSRELHITPTNLRVRAHRAGVNQFSDAAKKERKVPELRRDSRRDIAVPVPMPKKPPDARREWFDRWYTVLTGDELVALTGYKTIGMVDGYAKRLGHKKPTRHPTAFNRVGLEWVELVYPYLSDTAIAKALGGTVDQVRRAIDWATRRRAGAA